MAKMLAALNWRLSFCTTIADPSQPSVSELTAGVRLESIISAKNFELGGSDQEEITDPALTSMSNSSVGGRTKYNGQADFFRYTTVAEDVGWTTFNQSGLDGFLVKRIGLPYTQAWAALQPVMVYQIKTGIPMVLVPENDVTGYEKFRQRFFVQDVVNERAVVKA